MFPCLVACARDKPGGSASAFEAMAAAHQCLSDGHGASERPAISGCRGRGGLVAEGVEARRRGERWEREELHEERAAAEGRRAESDDDARQVAARDDDARQVAARWVAGEEEEEKKEGGAATTAGRGFCGGCQGAAERAGRYPGASCPRARGGAADTRPGAAA